MEPYGRGDWPAATRALEELLAERPENPPARVYLAAALEAQGQVARAEELWSALAAEPHGLLSRHARWRLALSAQAAGRHGQARAELELLASTPGAFSDDARALLPFIDEPARPRAR
jgi:cytochrome c-type biogenesis protein CcmH/NrfG